MGKLALFGGTPIRSKLFPAQNTIGNDEKAAALHVLNSGILTGYQGSWGKSFWGGKEVIALESEWAEKFQIKHAIACNSATSGLFIACGAVEMGRDKGDAIVTPFSMTCSATAPLGWGSGVRFCDIERDYYCLDAKEIQRIIGQTFQKFSAIIPVSLFGQPYDAEGINPIAEEKGIYVIEDAAQALGSKLNGKYAGTLGDIGVYSFNLGKHLTCGEGGMIVTNDDELAMKCRLIMNHAEAVMHGAQNDLFMQKFTKLFGFNLRMTEISAAIMRVQLRKMDELLEQRFYNVDYLLYKLQNIPCLEMPKIREGCTHTFYVLPLKYKMIDSLHRNKFIQAVKAELQPVIDRESEGVPIGCGYIQPIQSMPLFDMSLNETPECTRQWKDELIVLHRFFGPMAVKQDLDDIINAFGKVHENREDLIC